MTTKYEQIPSSLFVKNRKKFAASLLPKSLAIFNSNDIYPISADSTMPFQQHRDIFYLSGVDQEESILVIFPDAYLEENREILFLRETNEHIAVWEGEKLDKNAAIVIFSPLDSTIIQQPVKIVSHRKSTSALFQLQ